MNRIIASMLLIAIITTISCEKNSGSIGGGEIYPDNVLNKDSFSFIEDTVWVDIYPDTEFYMLKIKHDTTEKKPNYWDDDNSSIYNVFRDTIRSTAIYGTHYKTDISDQPHSSNIRIPYNELQGETKIRFNPNVIDTVLTILYSYRREEYYKENGLFIPNIPTSPDYYKDSTLIILTPRTYLTID